jgi:hypothetical protein
MKMAKEFFEDVPVYAAMVPHRRFFHCSSDNSSF